MLTFVPTPIGNLEDITLRTLRVLEESEVVLCEDTRVTSSLLRLLENRGYLRSFSAELMPVHSHNECGFLENVTSDFFERNVLYMCDAGTPCISDPGAALVRFVQEYQIPYTVLPGANAPLTIFAASGSTHKEFLFYGFLPSKQQERKSEFERLLSLGIDVIFYESPHRLLESLQDLERVQKRAEIFVAKEMTKHFETFYKGQVGHVLKSLSAKEIRGEWAFMVYGCPLHEEYVLRGSDIEALNLPPKVVAKIIAKMTGIDVKKCYECVIHGQNPLHQE
ncbi:16S rRNA (cytidine(1402)-2'-O)-methyltransferase [Helicobacter monodelphidis]|uniref:16S rRNA (cytidine(1402)-2'-O)-methyltransferase n=1 Tax=Helicobacter sp. 15-1451 TaxID=2004995 RepID=UPI000DCC591E|nr:16S rRNA (cytidine(1402)-2'-O)-methyltransferase [Helicobacter sp. 15-1451]RAX57791.1 16S rRNA (cytidine(1402)-2'-O)-methyltransferase [Helicobacter sp. 15-1451]